MPDARTIRNAVVSQGWHFNSRPWELNIVGIRSADTRPNTFNDLITVTWSDGARLHYAEYKATTDPGTYWLRNPMNGMGTAILMPGQYRGAYQIGLHKGSYTALVQRGPLKIVRDYDRDASFDFGAGSPITCNSCGINIHRASATREESTNVDKWSAGCQVFARHDDFDEFLQKCHKHRALYGNSFDYTLLDERMAKRSRRRARLYLGGAAMLGFGLIASALYNRD